MSGYRIFSVDELDRFQPHEGAPVLLPLQRSAGFEPFGVNFWAAEAPGGTVIVRHVEPEGDEELYVVVRGRATFTIDGRRVDAPAGTLVHVPPGVAREAVSAEEGTIVLAAGATAGEAWQPTGWIEFDVAFSLLRDGREAEARRVVENLLADRPGTWQGFYNAACFEARAGNDDRALAHLARAAALEPDGVRRYAEHDDDFEHLRGDARFAEALG